MGIKIFKILLSVFVLATLMGCPGEEDCNDLGSDVTVPNLAAITPLQDSYQQGDEITLSLSIPSENNYFGNTIDIFEQTQDSNPLLSFSSDHPFEGNDLNIIKGTQGEFINQFRMEYNSMNNSYELIVEIALNRIGQYIIESVGDRIDFQGNDFCNRFLIETNIQGVNSDFKIEFEVVG